MTDRHHAVPPGAPARTGWTDMWRAVSATNAESSGGGMPLRIGVERGMVATLAVAAPLLVLLSLPGFAADRRAGSALAAVSLCLAAVLVAAIPVTLVRRGTPAYGWLRLAAAAYAGLVALEPFELGATTPTDSTPWLIASSCIAFSCLAIGTLHPLRAGVSCGVIVAALTVVYLGRVPVGHLVVDAVGLTALAAGLIAGVTALRIRANLADSTQRDASELFDSSRRQAALEAERVRTDALLHDSVLGTLSAAAAGYDAPDQTLLMARTALDVVSDTADRPDTRAVTLTFERAVTAAKREFAPLRGLIQLDLAAASAVELPLGVAEALVSAMLQALGNSVKHAHCSTVASATATRTGDGGVRITISDEGRGFDMTRVEPQRLGVRVSILERMHLVGATAEVRSAPGRGTTVLLEWRPAGAASPADTRAAMLA